MKNKKAYLAEYYRVNHDRLREKQSEYRKTHLDQIRQQQAVYRKANREKMVAYLRGYYQTNRAKLLKQQSTYRNIHQDIIRDYQVKYRKTNREKMKGYMVAYQKANPHRMQAIGMAYKARKRLATIGDLTEIAKVYSRCRELRQWFDVVVDHTIPLAKGGTHEASNLQIIYASENHAKHDSLNYKPRVIFR